jgi:uncharacterized protein (TIGR02145 family)
MRKLIVFVLLATLVLSVTAQAPQGISHQLVIRNSFNRLVTNAPVRIKVSILQGSASGPVVYSETHSLTTNDNGLVSFVIGQGSVISGVFANINWASGSYFFRTEADPEGGNNYTISGTSQALSVPYALHAKTAQSLSTSLNESDPVFGASPAKSITSSNISNWNLAFAWGNHLSAGYVVGTRTITINGVTRNLTANRTWNVGTVTSLGLSLPNIFNVSGSPVTGSGTISASLVSQNANHVLASPNGTAGTPSFRELVGADIPNLNWSKITAGKPTTTSGYGITDAVTTSGSQTISGTKTFSGNIVANAGVNAGGNRITNMASPINNNDAATKTYVDNSVTQLNESDPVFGNSAAASITFSQINNWNTAYQWGNHASEGYIGGSRTITINGVTQNLAANRTWNVGTVTSVGLTMPNIFNVTGGPVTGSGTITANLISQNENLVLASPNGTSGTPAFRALLAADIPNLNWNKITAGKPTTVSGYGITDAVTTTGDQAIAGTKTFSNAIVANAGLNAGSNRITNMLNPVNNQDAATKAYVDNKIQSGTAAGQMLYWNGSSWIVIPPGNNGQSLVFCNGVPSWGGCIPDVTTSAITNNTGVTATGGGNVIQDGGEPVTQRGVVWGISQNPTITNNLGITIDGAGVGLFMSNLTGLSVLTTYYVRAYAINEIGVAYGNQVQFTTPQWTCGISAIGDDDGNVYNTVVIDNKCWMSENLNTGQQVTVLPSNNGVVEKYCIQNLGSNCDEYGGLYSWDELMEYSSAAGSQGICPSGWHIPTKAEYDDLVAHLGGSLVAGGKMKETGNDHWNVNTGATNESGFTAFGGGYYNSLYIGFKTLANFATSTSTGSEYFHIRLYNASTSTDMLTISKAAFVSVRCVKD